MRVVGLDEAGEWAKLSPEEQKISLRALTMDDVKEISFSKRINPLGATKKDSSHHGYKMT
jgi:hypothetical protein